MKYSVRSSAFAFLILNALILVEPGLAQWPMAGANPQRTSWTPEEVRGVLKPDWYRPIDPYIQNKVQLILANDTIYVSTARGLYALDAATGAQKWVYATQMPLGHSPTIHNGVAYVGGFDNKLHAIDAINGPGPDNSPLWTFTAEAGFATNPLVADNLVFAGNRDGYLYAIRSNEDPARGTLAWRYQTGGPILYSAAYADGMVFFASNDSYAYALNALTGSLKWKVRIPTGDGFHSWWPVVAGNMVSFAASRAYRHGVAPFKTVNGETHYDPEFTPPQVSAGVFSISSILSFFSSRPDRKVHYLLNLADGRESTIAPFLRSGTTASGSPFPIAYHSNGTIYASSRYQYERGQVVAWVPGAMTATTPRPVNNAYDEPIAFALGGDVVYWNLCCDREGGSFPATGGQDWKWFQEDLDIRMPGYDVKVMGHHPSMTNINMVYGGWNGIYGYHGDQNPPIPYKGRVYMHRANAVIAWSATGTSRALPLWSKVTAQPAPRAVDTNALKSRLASEIQKMIDAGHLRPGYGAEGIFSRVAVNEAGDNLVDYFSCPADTLVTLCSALPHLPALQQQALKTYLAAEFNRFAPQSSYAYTHTGWADGAAREDFTLPPEVRADMPNFPASQWRTGNFAGWPNPDFVDWPPHLFYALWKYALVFNNAKVLFDNNRDLMAALPADAVFDQFPQALNAWIAGYRGYMELERLAGYISSISASSKFPTYDRLLRLRVTRFNRNNPWGPDTTAFPELYTYQQSLSIARNFMYLTPELGDYLRQNALAAVQQALSEYYETAPYWFVTRFEATFAEGARHHLYDYDAIFGAKALILKEPADELVKYLDVPAFPRGDLFYIRNLIRALEAATPISAPRNLRIGP
jgi:hypothetical protein